MTATVRVQARRYERPTWYLAIGLGWLLFAIATIQGGTTPIWPVREIWIGCAFAAMGTSLLYCLFPSRWLFIAVTCATTITPALRLAGSLFFPAVGVNLWTSGANWFLITTHAFTIYALEARRRQ